MKRFSLWLKLAVAFQFLTGVVHALTLFVNPAPANDTERQLFQLMENYKFDLGAGFHRSMAELTTGLSICFSLVCFLGALMNLYLLRKDVGTDVLAGVVNINLIVFGVFFVWMCVFTFLPPIILTGLILVFLILARLTIHFTPAASSNSAHKSV